MTLTKSGIRAVDAAMEELLSNERKLLKELANKDQVHLAELLSALVSKLDSEVE